MKGKIIFVTLLAVFLMVMTPSVNAINFNTLSLDEKIDSNLRLNIPNLSNMESLGLLLSSLEYNHFINAKFPGLIINLIIEIIELFFEVIGSALDGIVSLIGNIFSLIIEIISLIISKVKDIIDDFTYSIIYLVYMGILGIILGIVWFIFDSWMIIVEFLIKVRDFLKGLLE